MGVDLGKTGGCFEKFSDHLRMFGSSLREWVRVEGGDDFLLGC